MVDENCEIGEAVVNGVDTKKRKTKSDYLREAKKLKLQKSKKLLTRSMKDQYLTLKKNVANLQRIHGVDAEFALIVKNNIQTTGAKNSAPTAGKYMVYSEGNLNDLFLSSGIKYDDRFVIMENDFDMKIKHPDNHA